MKYALTLAALVISSVALAEDTVYAANVYGCMPVSSKQHRTIISVPWCKMSATDDGAIEVSNVVKTAGLTIGDTLHAFANAEAFDTWKLQENDGVKYWAGVKQVSTNGTATTTDSSADMTIPRGKALILIRQNPTNSVGNANIFYVYGQVGTNSTVVSTAANNEMTLIAPCGTSDVNLVADGVISNPNADDMMQVPNPANGVIMNYTYTKPSPSSPRAWCNYAYDKDNRTWAYVAADPITVKAGTGFWYTSTRTSGDPTTFTWSGVPAK